MVVIKSFCLKFHIQNIARLSVDQENTKEGFMKKENQKDYVLNVAGKWTTLSMSTALNVRRTFVKGTKNLMLK